jgi:AcrR family transcriptional regulator
MVKKTRLPNARRARDADTAHRKPPARRTERGRKTRDQLLAGARTIFVRDGFLHARIVDICEEAGVSYGSFYTYFTSKEEIFQELLDEIEVDLLNVSAEVSDGDVHERVRAANRHFLEQYRDNAGILAVIDQVVTFDPAARARRDAREADFAAVLERRVRGDQREGLVDSRLDPSIAANALGAMVEAFAKGMYINGRTGTHDLDTVVEQLTLLWTNALGMPREEQRPSDADLERPARGNGKQRSSAKGAARQR